MASGAIDNSVGADLDSLVTWQYDNAPHLTGLVDLLKDFFTNAVSVPMGKILGLAGLKELDDDWALNVWGRLLGLPRPQLTIGSDTVYLSKNRYRDLLLARYRLLCGDASTDEYVKYVKSVFGGNASFKDNFDMTVTVTWETEETAANRELRALYDQYLKKIMLLPSGVCLSGDYSYRLFSIAETATTKQDERITNMNPNAGGCLYLAY